MRNNYLLLLLALVFLTGKSNAQTIHPCYTTEMTRIYKIQHPELEELEQQFTKQIKELIKSGNIDKYARTTGHQWDGIYDIPVVVHVIHNYGAELTQATDNTIYKLIAEMNKFYSLQNDTTSVVKQWKKYVGKANFRFHLATKDPLGNPTKGITHRASYLTYGGDDQAKMDQWPPTSYINIWTIARIGAQVTNGIIVAYATPPSSGAANPYYDGIITNYSFLGDASQPGASGGSIDHEMGHVLGLSHTFGKTNNPGPCPCPDPLTNFSSHCGDDDDVDDTPITDGCLGCCNLFDTVCSQNYYKIYTSASGADSLVNYPDTANEQNIMNYASCKVMLTKGQVELMRGSLNNDLAGRNNLCSDTNLMFTGALAPIPDLLPIVDFSVKNSSSVNTYFTCPGVPLKFTSQCWNDTVTTVNWTFTNGASVPTATATSPSGSSNNVNSTVNNFFSEPGWVSVTIAATGNNSGTTTTTNPKGAYVSELTGKSPDGYIQDFNTSGDRDKWPLFNYYHNTFAWELNDNVGFHDHSCIMYKGFDDRSFPTNLTGRPVGDFDDFFSIPVDLTSMATGKCNLNYAFSGATRTGNINDMNDTLQIMYSIDSSKTWKTLAKLAKSQIANKGAVSTAYTPQYETDWSTTTIPIPTAARTKYTVFCWRYWPGVNDTNKFNYFYSTGNNFYMDNVYFSPIPADVTSVNMKNLDIAIIPNPTSNDAYVVVKDASNGNANVIVTDVTGKVVYTTSEVIAGGEAHILIPQSVITVKGLYMVQVSTGSQTQTKKLVVY